MCLNETRRIISTLTRPDLLLETEKDSPLVTFLFVLSFFWYPKGSPNVKHNLRFVSICLYTYWWRLYTVDENLSDAQLHYHNYFCRLYVYIRVWRIFILSRGTRNIRKFGSKIHTPYERELFRLDRQTSALKCCNYLQPTVHLYACSH